jgi:aldose sugar dehydrogenase
VVWMAALRGEGLWRIPLRGDQVDPPQALFTGTYGRLRTALRAPDGSLWLTTSNTDGRGRPRRHDDQILQFTPS